ncbi:MAG: penicillin-binding transpeptidase domain-containing protein [Gemmatimonadaceae bacterium]
MHRGNRIGLVHAALALFAVALVAKAAQLQLWQQGRWAARAARQQVAVRPVPASRGEILDVGGEVLARSRDVVRLAVAPREVRDRAALRRRLERLGVGRAAVLHALDRRRAWVTLPGTYVAAAAARVAALRGVYTTPAVDRVYAMPEGLRGLVGRVDAEGAAVEGVELALDSLLRGRPGSLRVLRDASGRSFDLPASPLVAPTPGHTVVLTIDRDLQEIAERALGDAVTRLEATGGDVVVLDPHSGEVRAMASLRADPRSSAATALTEPFEPGSTAKPFIAAGLLMRGRVHPRDVVDTRGGVLTIAGRTIHDVHRGGDRMTLSQVLKWSSNVGIVRFAQRLTPREQYETLREFGFGAPTGAPYPSEAPGTLRPPTRWSTQSAASLAMGYEIAVTPLQLAAAYATFANGGELLEPALVREVRAPGGIVRYRHSRRVVRRVMTRAVADSVRAMLVDVVTGGTAVDADLSTFLLAGKTGTARRTLGGRYAAMQYFATFAGVFPADRPQFVIVVKLDSPKDAYSGGRAAAPVTRAVLEAALAARDAALDRRGLAGASSRRQNGVASLEALPMPSAAAVGADGSVRLAPDRAPAEPSRPVTVRLPYRNPRSAARTSRPIPEVRGLEMRDAVRALHEAGFRVHVARGAPGRAGMTSPAAGALTSPGSLVLLSRDP